MKRTRKQSKFYTVISCNIDNTTNERLVNLAKKTGRSKTFYIRQALMRHIDSLEKEFKDHLVDQELDEKEE